MSAEHQPEYIKPRIVFIAVGLPGSGKSYLARKLSEPNDDGSIPNITTLCQGTMTRDVFETLFCETVHQKKVFDDDGKLIEIIYEPQKLPHVFVDRCNSKPNDRATFKRLVRRQPIYFKGQLVPSRIICLIHLDFSEYYCCQLIDRRLKHGEDHPTVRDKETADKAMFCHKKMFQKPSEYEIDKSEGDRFIRISTPEQMANFIKKARKWL